MSFLVTDTQAKIWRLSAEFWDQNLVKHEAFTIFTHPSPKYYIQKKHCFHFPRILKVPVHSCLFLPPPPPNPLLQVFEREQQRVWSLSLCSKLILCDQKKKKEKRAGTRAYRNHLCSFLLARSHAAKIQIRSVCQLVPTADFQMSAPFMSSARCPGSKFLHKLVQITQQILVSDTSLHPLSGR